MRETGIFFRLDKQIFPIWQDRDDDTFEAVDFINMLPTLCILLYGCIIASVLVVLEKIHAKMYRRKNKIYSLSGKEREGEIDKNECASYSVKISGIHEENNVKNKENPSGEE